MNHLRISMAAVLAFGALLGWAPSGPEGKVHAGGQKDDAAIVAARDVLDQAKADEALAQTAVDNAKDALDAKAREAQKAKNEANRLESEAKKEKNAATKKVKQAAADAAQQNAQSLSKASAKLTVALAQARTRLRQRTADRQDAQDRLDNLLAARSAANKRKALLILVQTDAPTQSLNLVWEKRPSLKEISNSTVAERSQELLTKSISRAKAAKGNQYDEVVILENEQVDSLQLWEKLRSLAPKHRLDIHILTDGGHEKIIGYKNEEIGLENFFSKLKESIAKKEFPRLDLRSVYQHQSESGSLTLPWLEVGAQVVSSTPGYVDEEDVDKKKKYHLNYMPAQYYHFLEAWLKNQTFEQATQTGFDEAKKLFAPIYQQAEHPEYVTQSRLVITGRGDTKLR